MATSARKIIKSALILNGFELHLSLQRYCFLGGISIYYTEKREIALVPRSDDETTMRALAPGAVFQFVRTPQGVVRMSLAESDSIDHFLFLAEDSEKP